MTTEEYTEFVVFAKIFLQSKKFKGGADFRDIAHQVIADNENATMDECKLLIKKEYREKDYSNSTYGPPRIEYRWYRPQYVYEDIE